MFCKNLLTRTATFAYIQSWHDIWRAPDPSRPTFFTDWIKLFTSLTFVKLISCCRLSLLLSFCQYSVRKTYECLHYRFTSDLIFPSHSLFFSYPSPRLGPNYRQHRWRHNRSHYHPGAHWNGHRIVAQTQKQETRRVSIVGLII